MEFLSAYYFRAHIYTSVPRQAREDMENLGDSVSSDCQVFFQISGTTSSHVSPPGAFFAGVVGVLRRSGSEGVGIGWSVAKSGCARPPLSGAT